jgi:hypothetical protein
MNRSTKRAQQQNQQPESNSPATEDWLFLDDDNKIQGPYSAQMMRAWLRENYFGPDTLVIFFRKLFNLIAGATCF